MLSKTPRAKYRKVLLQLAHQPLSDGLPETPYVVAGITFAELSRTAGVPRSTLYRLWETQYDFWIDLSRYIAYEIDYSQRERELPWLERRSTASRRPILAADQSDKEMSAQANAVQAIVMDDFRVLIRAAFIGYPDVADLGRVRRHVETSRLESLGEELSLSWIAIGGAMFTVDAETEIAATMWCIADELSVLNRFFPEACGQLFAVDFGLGEYPWSLLALVLRSLCHGSPATDQPDRTSEREWYEIPPPDDPWNDAQLTNLGLAMELFVDSITSHHNTVEPPGVLDYVTVARVAAMAGVSRRTIYNVWPTRDEMMSDLLQDLLHDHATVLLAPFDVSPGPVTLGEITASLIGPSNAEPPAEPLLAFMIGVGNERHHSAIRRANQELIAQLAQQIAVWLDSVGRQPRDGIGFEQLAVIWLCLVRGGRRLRRTCPQFTATFETAVEMIMRELSVLR
ncbi:MAG TPA: TetR/AcrR family transcriptional regulator [Ilumatobacteraceae bacterium]|nr:TetR/AcrR family transcriptional regulator [Ilumatobacteraceae bacterium]